MIFTIVPRRSQRNTLSFDYSIILGTAPVPCSLMRKIAKLIRKGHLLFGSGDSEKEGVAYFIWGLLDINNMTRPLLQFKTPVHGDVDQATPLRAELHGLFAALYFV